MWEGSCLDCSSEAFLSETEIAVKCTWWHLSSSLHDDDDYDDDDDDYLQTHCQNQKHTPHVSNNDDDAPSDTSCLSSGNFCVTTQNLVISRQKNGGSRSRKISHLIMISVNKGRVQKPESRESSVRGGVVLPHSVNFFVENRPKNSALGQKCCF